MRSGEIAVSSLSNVLRKAAATESQQQQHQHDSQQQGLRWQAQQDAQEGAVNAQPDRQQHAAVQQVEIQEQQPQHGKEQQQQRQRMKELPHQQREEIQQPQREGEQQQDQLLQKQQGIPGKQESEEDERVLPRGGFCRRRPARVASVRFNVPPCPTGDSATDPRAAPINLVALVRLVAASADSASSAASAASVSSTAERTANVEADTCSPWTLPLAVSASTATAGREDAAARAAAEHAAADAAEGQSSSRAAGTSAAGPTDTLAAGESLCRAAEAHVSRGGDPTAGETGEPPRSFVPHAAEEPPDSLAAASSAQGKDKFRFCSSVESQTAGSPASPSEGRTDEKSAGGLEHVGTVGNGAAAAIAERGTAGFFAASPPVRSSRVVAADNSEAPVENFAAAADWNSAGAAVPSVGGEFRERRTSEVAVGCSSKGKESVPNLRRTSESSVSSGRPETQQFDEDQQHPKAKGLRAGLRHSVGQEVGSLSVQRSSSLPHEADVLHAPSAVASVPLVGGNGIRGIAESGASAEAAAAVGATALEAALAVDAAAAAAYPPTDLWAAADDKAAALRRGRAHILVSSTSTTRTRSLVAAAEGGTAAAACGDVAAPNACMLAASGNPSLPGVARRPPVTAVREPAAEGRPLPPHVTQEDAAQAAEDALEYCSDWSTFRRSTGRCSIVNPGAAVSFIKTAAGAWCNLGNGGDTNTRSRSREQLLRSSAGGVLPRCAAEEITAQQQQQRVTRDAAASSALRRPCYLNAAAVHAAATADAAAHYPGKRDSAATRKESRVTSSAVLNGDSKAATLQPPAAPAGHTHASAIRDVQHSRRPSSSSLQDSRQPCEADPAETGSLPDTTRNSTGRQLLSWWWGRRTQEQQQPLRPAASSQVLQRVQHQDYGRKQQSTLQHQQRHPQRQDQEMLPLPSRHQQWGIWLPAAGVKTVGGETSSGHGSTADATELERLLELEVNSDLRGKTDGEALQKEDLEAIVCNIQQVKNFLVGKLRECEAALLATAIERDDMEASLKELGRSLQQKEEQRENAVKQLQAENLEKRNEVERLQKELTWLREREEAQQQQIQQLQDESVLLRADVHDRVAASALEQESLLAVIKQLEMDKRTLQEQVEQLQQALAKSRQQLASALSRVDELEAFAPPALCGEGSRRSTSSSSSSECSSSQCSSSQCSSSQCSSSQCSSSQCSSSQCSSSQCCSSSPTASASRVAVDSLRPTWWSVSSRESPQQPVQQHPRHAVQQGQQQHGQEQQVSVLAFSSLEVDTRSSRNSPPQCGSASQPQQSSPEKAPPVGGSTRGGSTAASTVVPPPALSTTLDMSNLLQQHRQQGQEEETLQQSQWQKHSDQQQQHDHQKHTAACSAAQALEQLHASADAAAAAAQSSSSPKHTGLHRLEGVAVDEEDDSSLTETHTEESGAAAMSTPAQRSGATDSAAIGTGTVSHLAESGAEPRAAQASRDVTQEETVGHAEKIKEALAGGVSRVLQQLENVLTVEDRLIINESGVYTEDGVCLHRRGFTPSRAGLYAALWQQQEKHWHVQAQQQQDAQQRRQQKQKHQGRKGSQCTAENRQAGHQASGLQRSPTSSRAECICGSAISSDRSQSTDTKNLLLHRNSVSSSELEKEPKKRDAAGRAPALSSEDLLVVLSEAEEDNFRKSKDDRSTLIAPKTKESAGRSARRGAPAAGAAAVGSQHTRLQHQQQDQAKTSSGSSNAPSRLSRSSSAALVGGSVRDAVCSVLQAVHQRAVEVYVHPSSVLSTAPAAGTATSTNAAESSVQLARSTALSSSAGLAVGDTAASGDAAAHRSRLLQQHQHHHGAGQQSKSGRGRPSAWEHLLQRHREAQQMPLFGSTPYPGVTMSSSARQGGSSSSSHAASTTEGDTTPCYRRGSSNGSHKRGNSNEAGAVSTSDCPSSSPTDSEVAAVTHAASPAPGRQPVVIAHALQQHRTLKKKVEYVPRELAQAAREKPPPAEEHQQRHVQRERAGEGDHAAEAAALPSRQKDLPVQQTAAQGQVSERREELLRGNRELLLDKQGERGEYEVAKDARAGALETQQEEKVGMQRQIVNAGAAARENREPQDRGQTTADWSQRQRGTSCESGFVEAAAQRDDEQRPTHVHEAAHRQLPEDGTAQQLQQPLTKDDKEKGQDKVNGEEQLEVAGGKKEGEQDSIQEEQQQQLVPDRLKCQRGVTGEQVDDLCVEGTSLQRREDEEKPKGKQQLETRQPEDTQKQCQDVKVQQDRHQQSQARKVGGDASKRYEAQAQQQRQHVQQQEHTSQELKKKAEQTQQDTAQELHPESGRRRQQQPNQQKEAQQRGKQQGGQRRGGSSKTSGRQRRK